jgi:hypothetical protein
MPPFRKDDERSDEFLAECGRESVRLGLAVAWTIGILDLKAHTPGVWKKAKPFPDPENAAAIYVGRCRTRNPIHPVSLSNVFGIDFDGPVDELRAKYEIPELPDTVRVVTRRGEHVYLRPPEGRLSIKVEISEEKVTASEDGVLIGAGSLHRSGHVYEYESHRVIAVAPLELYEHLVRLAAETATRFHVGLKADGPIKEPGRRHTIFHFALELAHDGLDEDEIMPSMLALNRRCELPLSEEQIRGQVRGAVLRARKKPREPEQVRWEQEAERLLDEWMAEQTTAPRAEDAKTETETKSSGKKPALFLPFTAVQLTGPPRWLWRGKVPEGAVTLLAGRPKLGKSLLTIWLAAQLSRGLLEGSYHEQPARTLIIAAEDPPDLIVKPRLIAAAADELLIGTLVQRLQGHQGHQHSPREDLDGLDGLDRAGNYARRITIPDEYGLLEQIVIENGIALVVLDPINSFITHKVDAHRDAEIRRVLDPLAALSARRRFSALAVVHLNRRSDTDILNRITGSGGYSGSARSILTFGRHPENDAQRVVAAEGNWQKEAQSDLFELREVIVFPDAAPEEQTQPALVHIGVSDLESSDLIERFDDDRSALEDAKDFLLGELAFGPMAVVDLRRGADANGHSWPTLERAKKLLGVEARRISTAGGPRGSGRWEWFLELREEEPQE